DPSTSPSMASGAGSGLTGHPVPLIGSKQRLSIHLFKRLADLLLPVMDKPAPVIPEGSRLRFRQLAHRNSFSPFPQMPGHDPPAHSGVYHALNWRYAAPRQMHPAL